MAIGISLKQRISERTLTFLLCLFIYYPFFMVGIILIYWKRFLIGIKKKTGLGYKQFGRLGLVSRKHPISDVVDVSTKEELSFLKHRSPSYLYRMTVWTARELAKYLLRGQTVSLASEQEFAYALLFGVFAHSLTWHDNEKMYCMAMEGFDDFFLFRGFYWDARQIWVNKECTKMKIVFTDNREISWPCREKDLPEWKLAKLHAQVCMTYYAPGLSHNHVHFVFPSSVILVAKRYLQPNSFLYRLLEPHTQFTERINYQALNIGKATNNKRSILDRHFFFWQPIPLTVEQFFEGVAKKCYKYYYKDYEDRKQARVSNPGLPVHCNFPPPYVSNKKLREIPYLCFLASYYETVRDFVASVAHLIDSNEWDRIVKILKASVPGIDEVEMIDVIATFIHQVGVVHFCDHETFLRFYGRQFGCMCIRTPYEPWSNVYHWDTAVGDVPNVKYAEECKKNPLNLIRTRDVMRTRCFQNVFVDFIADWSLDLRLSTTMYDFDLATEKEATDAVQEFKLALSDLDSRLEQTEPPIVVPPTLADTDEIASWAHGSAGQGQFGRATNMQLIPFQDMIRSVCF